MEGVIYMAKRKVNVAKVVVDKNAARKGKTNKKLHKNPRAIKYA